MDRISGLDVRPTSEYPAKNLTVIRPVALSPDNNTFCIRPDTNIRPDNQVGIKQLYYTEYPARFGAVTDTRPGRIQNLYATGYPVHSWLLANQLCLDLQTVLNINELHMLSR